MKIAVIKDVRTFLTLAHTYGFYFREKYCIKNYVYKPINSIVEVKIDLTNGNVSFGAYANNVSFELSQEDKQHLLKEFDYLVQWTDIECLKE